MEAESWMVLRHSSACRCAGTTTVGVPIRIKHVHVSLVVNALQQRPGQVKAAKFGTLVLVVLFEY
jgi:hypothetical protein